MQVPGVVSVSEPQLIPLSSKSPDGLHHIITAGPAIQPICMHTSKAQVECCAIQDA